MRASSCAVLLLALSACAPDTPLTEFERGELDITPTEAYRMAAQTWDVPMEILQAISHAQTGMQSVQGEVEFDGKPALNGMMGLREDIADEAAELSGHDPSLARTHFVENIDAAAAWLSEEAERQDIDRRDIGAWAPVVIAYAGIETEDAAATYVWDEIYGAIARGFDLEGAEPVPLAVDPQFPEPIVRSSGGDRSYAIWRPSPNRSSAAFGSRRGPVDGDHPHL